MKMADPKFANLPGIAHDQPDVYETPDIPDQETSDYYEEAENESIERLHISTKESYNRFKGKYLTGKVDFSDSLSKRMRTGYDAISGDLELAGEGEKETPIQKYHRIHCEMNELMEELSALQSNSSVTQEEKKSYEAVGEVVCSAKKMLDSLRLEQVLGKETVKGDSEVKKLITQVEEFKKSGKMVPIPIPVDPLGQSSRLAELDQRLHVLEKAIGAKPEKLSRLAGILGITNLIEAVQQLATKSALLQPNQLDLIEARLVNLAGKMDAIEEKQSPSGESGAADQARDQKTKELYEIAKRTEPIAQTLPDVLSRMQALESLHKYANNFTKLLAELEATQNMITVGIGNNKVLLQKVQEAFAENLENVNQEVAKLDARLNTLAGQKKK